MIMCKICGVEFEMITPSHLKYRHGLTISAYRNQYGDIMSEDKKTAYKERIKENHWARRPVEETKHIREAVAKAGVQRMKKMNDNGKAFRWDAEKAAAYWDEIGRAHV